MTRAQAASRLGKLEAITVERGATRAEALLAADHARRLARQFGLRPAGLDPGCPVAPACMRGPGVHVTIV